jgi:glycine/D-amino acid oxidase-like deaminating enzyme
MLPSHNSTVPCRSTLLVFLRAVCFSQTPHPTLSRAQSIHILDQADIVVIGSGITAASVTRTVLENGKSVVILEARDLCEGRILETAEDYKDLEDHFSEETAKTIMRFRLSHLKTILDAVDELSIREESQARKVQFLSAYFNEKTWEKAKERLKRSKDAMPEEYAEWASYEKPLPEEFRLPTATGVISCPAGALWPYKFVTGVFDHLLRKFPTSLRIKTNTLVTEIHCLALDSDSSFSIGTPRGSIKCQHVVHCINGHVGHLVPQLKGCIYPVRSQMSAQKPEEGFPAYGRSHS